MDNEKLKEILLTMTNLMKGLESRITYLEVKTDWLENELERRTNERKDE